MNTAVLVLLASGVGINFGWQPMPDGSPRYEYLVQLEPELAATLAAGQTIPISGEVPDEIHPIGRIRIVVGRNELPKQTMTTRMKPFAEAGRPPRPRYKNPSGQQAVPSVGSNAKRYLSQPTAGSNFGGTLQRAAQQGIQNGVQQLFGNSGGQQPIAGTTENQPLGQRALGHAEALLQNTQNNLQRGVDPVRRTVQQTGEQFRGVVQGLGDRARETVDQLGRPLQSHSAPNRNQSQPSGHGTADALGNGSSADSYRTSNTAENLSRVRRLDQPTSNHHQADDWRSPHQPDPSHNRMDNHDTRSPWVENGSSNNFGRYRHPSADDNRWAWPPLSRPRIASNSQFDSVDHRNTRNTDDPYDIANRRSRFEQQPPLKSSYMETNSWAKNEGPKLPRTRQHSAPDPFVTNHRRDSVQSAPAASSWPDLASSQEINSDMFYKPANAELPPLPPNDLKITASNAPFTITSRTSQTAADYGRDEKDSADRSSGNPQTDSSQPEKTKSVFPLILSWVLLSGSGAGNMYLFWSYLDVRNKYRSLARNASKKFGRRFRDLDD